MEMMAVNEIVQCIKQRVIIPEGVSNEDIVKRIDIAERLKEFDNLLEAYS